VQQPIDTPTAVGVLAEFGYDKPKLAAHLGVTLRSVQRWAAGRHNPSKRNLVHLRALVGQLIMFEGANGDTARARSRMRRLEVAAEALLTEAERMEVAALEERAKAPRVSITAEADPFELCQDAQAEAFDAIEALFPTTAGGVR
jgi:hypothetical protein